jgi:hypothetical protein
MKDRISELKDKNRNLRKNRRNLSKINQKLWLHQKTKPKNHGYWKGEALQVKGIIIYSKNNNRKFPKS